MPDVPGGDGGGVCRACGGRCCHSARPPLTPERIRTLESAGVPYGAVERGGYSHLGLRPDGYCVLFHNGLCTVHDCKPETCVAGPFTFDILDGKIGMYIKNESECPLVGLLKRDPGALEMQYRNALACIRRLVRGLTPGELRAILSIEEPETTLWAVVTLEDEGPCA